MIRIVAMAAYRRRLFNWLIGLGAGAAILLSAFSGYVLPWDQRAYFGARVVAGLLDYVPLLGGFLAELLFGGSELGPSALTRLHAIHVTATPALVFALVVVHLWRVRRDGGLARSGADQALVPARPLFAREILVALVVVALLLAAAALFAAPLGSAADYTRPANPEKAPWYFLGLQELASRSAVIGALVIPALVIALLIVLPLLDTSDAEVGNWGVSRPERAAYLGTAIATLVAIVVGYALPGNAAAGASLWPIGAPFGTAALAFALTLRPMGRRAALRAALVAVLCALAVFSLVGACRGPGWSLVWPWGGNS